MWYETQVDRNGNTLYYLCQECLKFPAIATGTSNAYCKACWHLEIDKQFNELYKKLEDEDWGSSPEIRGEI